MFGVESGRTKVLALKARTQAIRKVSETTHLLDRAKTTVEGALAEFEQLKDKELQGEENTPFALDYDPACSSCISSFIVFYV